MRDPITKPSWQHGALLSREMAHGTDGSAASSGVWACPRCTLENEAEVMRCEACNSWKPGATPGDVFDSPITPLLELLTGASSSRAGRPAPERPSRGPAGGPPPTWDLFSALAGARPPRPPRHAGAGTVGGSGGSGGGGRAFPTELEQFMLQVMQTLEAARGPQMRPAEGRDIAALPTRVLREEDVAGANDENRACAVCMEDFAVGEEQRTLPCFHRFHKGCIDKWLENSGICPICKNRVDEPEEPPAA